MKKKKKGFHTNLCRFEIFSMKIVYAIEPELCCPNQMTNSLRTKTKIKKILYSDWLPNLSIFPLHGALEIGEILILRGSMNKNKNSQKNYCIN